MPTSHGVESCNISRRKDCCLAEFHLTALLRRTYCPYHIRGGILCPPIHNRFWSQRVSQCLRTQCLGRHQVKKDLDLETLLIHHFVESLDMRRCIDFHWECKCRNSAMQFRHLLWSGCECQAFKSRHDSATTATQVQGIPRHEERFN